MIKIYHGIKSFLASLLFPRICIGCNVEGRWICDECLRTIDIIKQPFCPECRRPTLNGEFCGICRGVLQYALDGIFICANFEKGILKEAIHQFKYNGIMDIGGILGRIMAGKLKNVRLKFPRYDLREYPEFGPPEFDFVIPVPLHKKRWRERGFNQAEILARAICTSWLHVGAWSQHPGKGLTLAKNVLVRKKYTVPQAELGREERLKNLREVFAINNKWAENFLPLQGKNVLLVDDITTTGSTLEECAKVLKANGAKMVWAIVLAKGK